jgi:hypothetical protein
MTKPDPIFGDVEDDGDRRGCRLGRKLVQAVLRQQVAAAVKGNGPARRRLRNTENKLCGLAIRIETFPNGLTHRRKCAQRSPLPGRDKPWVVS